MLSCTGSIIYDKGKLFKFDHVTAMLDLENHFFQPPMFDTLPLTEIAESHVYFARETSDHLSIQGSLDRVSGTVTVDVATPAARKKYEAREEGLAWLTLLTAQCELAQRKF
jgi:hypothetical protein